MCRAFLLIVVLAVLSAVPAIAQRAIGSLPAVLSTDSALVDVVERSQTQPVIVIRFLGSLCSHCMQQIVALNERSEELKALNTRIIAFSNNLPSKCAEVVRDYRIDTSVIDICSDPENSCSRTLGSTIPENDGTTTELHAFLIVNKGVVHYEHYSTTPLMSFASAFNVIRSL